jgi:hypothetical protein
MLPLMAMVPLDANAFPVFCSDITSAPYRELTGCQFDAFPSNMQSAFIRPIAEAGRTSDEIDEMLSRTPKNPQLFHIGPGVIDDNQNGKAEESSPAGEAEKQLAVGLDVAPEASESTSKSLHRDDNWYYMNIDQDGTHLFFGDVPEVGEPTSGGNDDDFLPDGIGIGKKWHF